MIEVLLIGFQGDLYDQKLTVDCLKYLRPQKKYSSLEELKLAIETDVSVIKMIVGK